MAEYVKETEKKRVYMNRKIYLKKGVLWKKKEDLGSVLYRIRP